MTTIDQKKKFFDACGLIAIGIFSFGYIFYVRSFAELHLDLPFLNFPVFVGEVLLFLCLALYGMKYALDPRPLKKWYHWAMLAYCIFVVTKALVGYIQWGPLALRNSALFYYPAFAVLGYCFYRRDFFDPAKTIWIVLIITAMISVWNRYWILTASILGFILIRSLPRRRTRMILYFFLFLFIPYPFLFFTSRMMMVSNTVAGLYLVIVLGLVAKVNNKLKLVVTVFGILVVLFGLFRVSDTHELKSLVSFKRLITDFHHHDQRVRERLKNYNPKERTEPLVLFNPDEPRFFRDQFEEIRDKDILVRRQRLLLKSAKDYGSVKDTTIASEILQGDYWESVTVYTRLKRAIGKLIGAKEKSGILEEEARLAFTVPESMNNAGLAPRSAVEQELSPEDLRQIHQAYMALHKELRERNISVAEFHAAHIGAPNVSETAKDILFKFDEATKPLRDTGEYQVQVSMNNAIFRLFIWRDMLVELLKEKPVFGFSFGKPLRSVSLEVLHWAESEWSRDGWIAAHNSYLHMIYRGGIVGILIVLTMIYFLFRMIIGFIRMQSLTGVLLCGALLNWAVATNFLLVLELPYTAIPLWSLWGMTFAYYQSQVKKISQPLSGVAKV